MPNVFEFEDATFRVGRNARENWDLIENAENGDIWLHLHNQPSCHVMIECKKEITQKHIIYGGGLCKEYSKCKTKSVSVSALDAEFVKKGKVVGEAKLLKNPDLIKI